MHNGFVSQTKRTFSLFFKNWTWNFFSLARLRRPPAAFLLNRAITRGANGTKTFPWLCQSYMPSFIKIGVLVFEKNDYKTMTLCNFNKDVMLEALSHF